MRQEGPPARDREAVEKAVVEHLREPGYRPVSLHELLDRLRVPRQEKAAYRKAVRDLLASGRIVSADGRKLAAVEERLVRGRLHVHPRGFAFVRIEGPGRDVFIPPRRLGGAHHGDAVEVRILGADREGRPEGEVSGVVDRRGRRVQGLFRGRDRGGLVQPFDPSAPSQISIPGAFRMGAEDGDAVEVLVLRPGASGEPSEGKVVEVFGRLGDPGVDTMVVARRHDLRTEFPEEILEAARRLPDAVPREEASRRERFEDPPPVTIDGETARDFDDAIAISELPGGGFRLFVHIADVAFFARPNDDLDAEARARGTSVYFPDRVFPMFPEKLSNDLCSLRPGEDRLVQSAILDLDARGEVLKTRFADGVIRSAARLTYTQVAALLDGQEPAARVPKRLAAMLHTADRLRDLLEGRRRARGSVDFDLPEPRILLDVEGVMTGIKIEPRNRAHRMIEEFMLAANEAVAGHLDAEGAPCLYRIHEAPDPAKVEALAEFAATFGLVLSADPESVRPKDVQRLVEAAEGRPEQALVSQVALRSMKQARYSPENLGHFGLAAPVYAHFTSPIRRYPDLVLHRLLRAFRRRDGHALASLSDGLDVLADGCSKLEREAEAAERELLEWKKIAFMKGKEGETFDGLVTGVTRFGLFVQLRETLAEGLLHVERLGDERFEFAERRMELLGERSGAAHRLGDPLRVVVDRVDLVLRRLDFSLAPDSRPAARKPAAQPPRGGARPRERGGGRPPRRGGREGGGRRR